MTVVRINVEDIELKAGKFKAFLWTQCIEIVRGTVALWFVYVGLKIKRSGFQQPE